MQESKRDVRKISPLYKMMENLPCISTLLKGKRKVGKGNRKVGKGKRKVGKGKRKVGKECVRDDRS